MFWRVGSPDISSIKPCNENLVQMSRGGRRGPEALDNRRECTCVSWCSIHICTAAALLFTFPCLCWHGFSWPTVLLCINCAGMHVEDLSSCFCDLRVSRWIVLCFGVIFLFMLGMLLQWGDQDSLNVTFRTSKYDPRLFTLTVKWANKTGVTRIQCYSM